MATATGTAAQTEEPLTYRRDPWWAQPLAMFTALTAFVIYATYRVFENDFFYAHLTGGHEYISPFASPNFTPLFEGTALTTIPVIGAFFLYPAFVILPLPAGFRFTCYYFRRAYYRSFVARPAACAVPAFRGLGYKGERGLLVFQNLHRYFLYAALGIIVIHTYDVFHSIIAGEGLYFGLGTFILAVDVILLAGYAFGCHSFRHLIGGKLDCFSCDSLSRTRHGLWSRATWLNERHALFGWISLFWVAVTDFYIRYLSSTGATTFLGVPA